MPKPVRSTMCFLLMTVVPVQKLCVNIYSSIRMIFIRVLVTGRIYIHIYIYTYTGSVVQYSWSCTTSVYRTVFWECAAPVLNATFFFCGFTNFAWLYDNETITGILVTIGIRFKQNFDTKYFAFWNLSPPRMFLSLDLLLEHGILHGTIGPIYVIYILT